MALIRGYLVLKSRRIGPESLFIIASVLNDSGCCDVIQAEYTAVVVEDIGELSV